MDNVTTAAPEWPFVQAEDQGIYGGILMSNFDHEVNEAVAERMKSEHVLAEYTGYHFHAVCWYLGEQYHAEVSVYGIPRATISADTPQEVMREVCEAFGSD
jgi:hypothetical protein